jgi:hypothetical protein
MVLVALVRMVERCRKSWVPSAIVAGIDPNRAVKAVRPESAPHGAFHMVVDQLGE